MATPMEQEVLREIPGYKAILKSVLKSQIQFLLEQLSDQGGEESVILTASVHDGSLSALGSHTGRGFMDGKDDIKAQFLGYCLKSKHHRESSDADLTYQRSRTLLPPSRRPKPRLRPSPYSMPSPGHATPVGSPPTTFHMTSPLPGQASNHSNQLGSGANYKQGSGHSENDNVSDTYLDSAASDGNAEHAEEEGSDTEHSREGKHEGDQDEEGLEENSLGSHEWGGSYGSGQRDENGDDQDKDEISTSQARNLGGIAFPGLDNAHHDFSKSLPELSPAELKNVLYQGLANQEAINSSLLSHSNSIHGVFDPYPRKRGRPRKNSFLYGNEASHISQNNLAASSLHSHNSVSTAADQANDGRTPLKTSPSTSDFDQNSPSYLALPFKRGRPRKEYENLPPGVVHPTGISIGNGYVKCNICGKVLKGTSMFTHKQAHLGIRNYSCNYCGKSFTQKGPLITHERVHTGEKPYTCGACGKCFSAHSGLYQHKRRCSKHAFSELNLTM
ncbi:zinc finger protein with KRAB and SCAN domains 1-like [Dreissena polymorpha]|nr:zinc finger protein with KRAB and SCAN domains 1-like [Dreissena polymorpha]